MIVNLPYKILIEKSVDKEVEKFLSELGLGKKCAIVGNKRRMDIIGNRIIKAISKNFEAENLYTDSIEKNELKKFSERIKDFDFIIGLGGGKTIDITKYSSFLAKKPWIAFPTVLSHDGVVSSRASINHNCCKISVDAQEPIAIIADLDTIKKAPYERIAAGAGDLISNISAVEDWKIAAKRKREEYHTLMAELSLLSVRAVVAHIDDIRKKNYHGLEILLWSLICAGFAMNIYGSSRPCSGSEHNFSHALDKLGSDALHGEQCALGTIIMTYLQGGDWEKIRGYMIKLGLPTNSKKIGIREELLVNALVSAKDVRKRYTILNEKNITKESARKILKKVRVI